jgi:ADP-ribosylglycohydrolase
MKPETKYKGSIKLSAIGDALGWMTEFEKTPDTVLSKFGTYKIEQFYDWEKRVGGRFYGFIDKIKAGSYSDDTQLLLAVARSIRSDATIDNKYFAKSELVNWLAYARGGGRTVKAAAHKISRKSTNWNNNFFSFKVKDSIYDYRQSGANGAAMRVLPIALANIGNAEKIKEDIFCNSIITHGHPRAILGAMLYGYAINQIIVCRPEDFNWEKFLIQIGSDFHDKFELTFLAKSELRQWVIEWNKASSKNFQSLYDETVAEVQNQLRFLYQSIKQELPVLDTLVRLGCLAPDTKGSGTATVLAGLYFTLKFYKNPLKAITEAVNSLGVDTDTIASFTGGLIGALYGQSVIPNKWMLVQDVKYLDFLAERLLMISEDRLKEVQIPSAGNLKQLNDVKNDDFEKNESVEFFPLGRGVISLIDRQPTLTKGKYNLVMEINFDSGQSIQFSKLFDNRINKEGEIAVPVIQSLLSIAAQKLKPKTFGKLSDFIQRKEPSDEVLDVLIEVLENKD